MSANIKKTGRIGTKIVAGFLFLFLIMFNVEVGLYDAESSGSGILGLTMSVFVPGALAGGGAYPEIKDPEYETYADVCCGPGCYLGGTQRANWCLGGGSYTCCF